MKSELIVFRRVFVEMCMLGWDVMELAKACGVSYVSLRRKLCGESPWLLEECIAVKEALKSDMPIETLFERFGNNA